jgi:hypothetical protein
MGRPLRQSRTEPRAKPLALYARHRQNDSNHHSTHNLQYMKFIHEVTDATSNQHCGGISRFFCAILYIPRPKLPGTLWPLSMPL